MKILDSWKSEALVDKEQYENLYKESILENDDFWNKQGNKINWIKKYSKIKDIKYCTTDVNIKQYYDGTLNVAENCIDRMGMHIDEESQYLINKMAT